MASLILFNYFRSSTSYRVRIALNHKNLGFDYVPVHLLNNGGEQNQESYKRQNPMGEVPTLQIGNDFIGQSLPIMEYLEEVFPQNPILPKNPLQRAQVRQFCENINSFMHPLSNLKVQQYLEKKHGYTPDDKAKWIQHWSLQGLAALEQTLKKESGQFCFGDTLTMADFCLIPQAFSSERFGVDLSAFGNIQKITTHCLTLDIFKKAHPYRQIDTPDELKIN